MAKSRLRGGALTMLISILATGVLAANAPAARRALTADDIYRMESVSEPQISPDGQWVAYLVTINDRAADEERNTIWMVSWDGAQHVELTHPSNSLSSPRWSPDGRYLAYLAKPADSEHSQIMLLDRRGGEAQALTHVSDDILSFGWSPDGRRMVLAMVASGESPETAAEPNRSRPSQSSSIASSSSRTSPAISGPDMNRVSICSKLRARSSSRSSMTRASTALHRYGLRTVSESPSRERRK
jgi:dipeptidyl aminopeptidase/acylaminoacyl peptidase